MLMIPFTTIYIFNINYNRYEGQLYNLVYGVSSGKSFAASCGRNELRPVPHQATLGGKKIVKMADYLYPRFTILPDPNMHYTV
jgi:hypothetical protein